MPAGDWFVWMIMTGRGWGKTRTAVENMARMQRGDTPLIAPHGSPAVMSIVADTAFDMRQYSIEGPSGFLNVGPPEFRPTYHPGQSVLKWPNGARALLFSAEDPEVTRGASGSFFWWDELAKARRADQGWANMLFGMREGKPRGIVTTTPRPIPLIKKLVRSPSTKVTVGSTWDNRTNIAKVYYDEVIAPLEGTRLGRQEINAEIIEDLPGALWTRAMIDQARANAPSTLPDMSRIVVAVDPSGARTITDVASSSIGIVVASRGVDGRGYVFADRSCKLSPAGWARRAIAAYYEFDCDRLLAERNFGGSMVEYTIKSVDPNVSYSEVVASRGKVQRAEPVAALYERGLVSHIGDMPDLEDQMCLDQGTLIETARGQVPIEHVTANDSVMTRRGFAPLRWAGQTGVTDRLIELRTEKSVLRATRWHPVFLSNGQRFVAAARVLPSDLLSESPRWASTGLRWRGEGDGGIGCGQAIIGTLSVSFSIGRFLRRIAGLLANERFTTLMATPATTNWAIFAPSPGESIMPSMTASALINLSGLRLAFASYAAQRRGPLRLSQPGTVAIRACGERAVRGRPVFNLSVAQGFLPEFYANGVLVHNCQMATDGFMGEGSPDRVDACVWALSELLVSGSQYDHSMQWVG